MRCEKCGVIASSDKCPRCRAKRLVPVNKTGPGTELRAIIPNLFKRKGCGCNDYARKMDRWGIEGCEKRKEEIVAHLVNQAKRLKVPKAVSGAMARRWVEKAISKAKEQDVER